MVGELNMIKFNGKILKVDGKVLNQQAEHNPLDLPEFTIRVKTNGNTPLIGRREAVLTQVDTDIWDVYLKDRNWHDLFNNESENTITEVLGANTVGVTNMANLFKRCNKLTTCALFDTHYVTDMSGMFNASTNGQLTSLPLFDTSNVENMNVFIRIQHNLTSIPCFDLGKCTNAVQAFGGTAATEIPDFNINPNLQKCDLMVSYNRDAESGILRLYNKLVNTPAGQTNNHWGCFAETGSDTESGAAELAQIPSDWK